ncbi:hypothetical protein PPL_02555 [Heterostelium album PN500]|uniref:Uncharacterized protein n=1 Tax=Heterostelium pallidum (strain ATCC 26659 / Pp 5 / PN500) TaxID=670386 RepID=D3B2E4_HETP5|nr:hypothetical protein PPL_02555 [Heterostelium album PN500]EFA84519.1 hypothetical protein PPL_02555 [Heterostelium album PN500]|eukprot:XP_020436632.1 hypothetical protein PPL_02555 [Heterostelium album PN500]
MRRHKKRRDEIELDSLIRIFDYVEKIIVDKILTSMETLMSMVSSFMFFNPTKPKASGAKNVDTSHREKIKILQMVIAHVKGLDVAMFH